MTNTEGFLIIILLIDFFFGIIGLGILLLIEWISRRIRSGGEMAVLVAAGYIASIITASEMDASLAIASSAIILVPLAAVLPQWTRRQSRQDGHFPSLLSCFIILWCVSVLLPIIIVWSAISMVPFIYWHSPLSNSMVLAGVFLIFLAVSWTVYELMARARPVPAAQP